MLYKLIVTLAFQDVSTTFFPSASTALALALDFLVLLRAEPVRTLVGFAPTADPADDARDDPADPVLGVAGGLGFGTIPGITAGAVGGSAISQTLSQVSGKVVTKI